MCRIQYGTPQGRTRTTHPKDKHAGRQSTEIHIDLPVRQDGTEVTHLANSQSTFGVRQRNYGNYSMQSTLQMTGRESQDWGTLHLRDFSAVYPPQVGTDGIISSSEMHSHGFSFSPVMTPSDTQMYPVEASDPDFLQEDHGPMDEFDLMVPTHAGHGHAQFRPEGSYRLPEPFVPEGRMDHHVPGTYRPQEQPPPGMHMLQEPPLPGAYMFQGPQPPGAYVLQEPLPPGAYMLQGSPPPGPYMPQAQLLPGGEVIQTPCGAFHILQSHTPTRLPS